MDKHLDEDLVKTHPLLFKDRHRSMRETCMCWGFPGNGWYDIIKELADKLEPLIEKFVEENPGGGCYQCGCDYLKHRPMPSGKEICTTVHELPYTVGKRSFGCCVPQWGRDLKNAWKGFDWEKAPRYKRIWRTFKQLLRDDWKYTKYRNIHNGIYRRINQVLRLLFKLGLKEKLPCKCIEFEHRHPRASQVKEKFGTLSFYMSSATDEMWDLISEAERKSGETCEDCGAPGRRRGGGWIVTLCDECAKLANKEITYEEWAKELEASGRGHAMMSFTLRAKADE